MKEANNFISTAPTLVSTTNLSSSITLSNDNNAIMLSSYNTNTLLASSSSSFNNINVPPSSLPNSIASSSANIDSSLPNTITLPLSTSSNGTSSSSNNTVGITAPTNNVIPTGRKRFSNVWLFATESDDGQKATCQLCNFTCSSKSHSTSTILNHLISKHKKHELNLTKSSSKSQLKVSEQLKRYLPPHRNQVSGNLKRLYHHYLQMLKDELKEIDYIGLTLDFWSSRTTISFLCITGHWFNTKHEYFSKVLHFSSFNERHTNFNISCAIKESLQHLGIYSKIVAITCDGGENLVAACNQLDSSIKRIWCCTHRLHLVVINGLGICNKEKPKNHNQTTTVPMLNDSASDNHEQSMDTSWSDDSETDIDQDHTSTECDSDSGETSETQEHNSSESEDSVDESEVDTSIEDNWSSIIDVNVPVTDEISLIMDLLQKIRLLATVSKKSYLISNFIRTNKLLLKLNKTLNDDCQSRWNSTYILIDSLLKLKPLIIKLFIEKKILI
ncbi:unnamed protein product [Rotaria magnacalcarata]|uniref:BED-type domain-containing protein n=1 Tax=Rotaria magnacalcarata TaxID=392030 RepID=A0A816M0Q8_9BILA|nr:unnamed protein product [Rotaria magnacalcarata]